MTKRISIIALFLLAINSISARKTNPFPEHLGFRRIHRNMMLAMTAYVYNFGFVPQTNCKYTSTNTFLADGRSVGALQIESLNSFLQVSLPSAEDRKDFLEWLCSQHDKNAEIYQRALDAYSFDDVVIYKLYANGTMQQKTHQTFMDTKFAIYANRLPTKKERKALRKNPATMKKLQADIEAASQAVANDYKGYQQLKKLNNELENLKTCIQQTKSASLEEIKACLEIKQ